MLNQLYTFVRVKLISKILVFALILPFFGGCGRQNKSADLLKISIGMSKSDIVERLGKPTKIRGPIRDQHGNATLEIYEYKVNQGISCEDKVTWSILTLGLAIPFIPFMGFQSYWLVFEPDKLTECKKAGDWKKLNKDLVEAKFRKQYYPTANSNQQVDDEFRKQCPTLAKICENYNGSSSNRSNGNNGISNGKSNGSCGYGTVQGYGQISKTTGRPRTNIVSGHYRNTSRGRTYVKSYARS